MFKYSMLSMLKLMEIIYMSEHLFSDGNFVHLSNGMVTSCQHSYSGM